MAEIVGMLDRADVRLVRFVEFCISSSYEGEIFSEELVQEVDNFDPQVVIQSMEVPAGCFGFLFFYCYQTFPSDINDKEDVVFYSDDFLHEEGKMYFFFGEVCLSSKIRKESPEVYHSFKDVFDESEKVIAAKVHSLEKSNIHALFPFRETDEVLFCLPQKPPL